MQPNSVPTPDPDSQTGQSNTPPPTKLDNRLVHIILFFLLFFFILLFYSNVIIATILAGLLNLLSISIFDFISHKILDFCGRILEKPIILLKWIWYNLIVRHLTPLGPQLTDHIKPWFARYRQFVTIVVTLIITVIMLASTILHPAFATAFGNLNDTVCLHTPLLWPTCDSGLGISTLPNAVRIGLIEDNTNGPFDQSIENQYEKNIEDPIFRENRYACIGPHFTIVDATMLSRTVEDPMSTATSSLEDLEGVYLAQHDYNANNPALKMCLVIANLGTSDTADKNSLLVKSHPDYYALPQVVHQIDQFARNDSSLRGIIGFRYSQQVTEALDLMKGYQNLSAIPIISSSASSDEFSNIPNFYRIVSPDHSQGTVLAQFFCDKLIQSRQSDSIAMLRDDSNPYSRSLESAFSDAVSCLDPAHKPIIPYSNGDAASITQAVDKALSLNATFIFFPGYDQDLDTLELEIHLHKQDKYITVLGGDGISNIDSTTHYSYTHVYSTDFAGPLPEADHFAQSFIHQKGFLNPPFINTIPSYKWLSTTTLTGFDSVEAFTTIAQNGAITQNDFNQALANVSFKGASGDDVTFQGTRDNGHSSDREQGYVYITCNDYGHNLHLIAKYSTTNTNNGQVENLPADGASDCSP